MPSYTLSVTIAGIDPFIRTEFILNDGYNRMFLVCAYESPVGSVVCSEELLEHGQSQSCHPFKLEETVVTLLHYSHVGGWVRHIAGFSVDGAITWRSAHGLTRYFELLPTADKISRQVFNQSIVRDVDYTLDAYDDWLSSSVCNVEVAQRANPQTVYDRVCWTANKVIGYQAALSKGMRALERIEKKVIAHIDYLVTKNGKRSR